MDTELQISFPTDDDDFFRRECPHCLQEFKWTRAFQEAELAPDQLLYCPYCGQFVSKGDTWTSAQNHYIEEVMHRDVLYPELVELQRTIRSLNRPGGSVTATGGDLVAPDPVPPVEANDMRVLTFPCHPEAPVKVLDNWDLPVHCLVCGREYAQH